MHGSPYDAGEGREPQPVFRPAADHGRVVESARGARAVNRRRRCMPRREMSCWVLHEQ
jgi:hypothetical protein